MTAQAFLTDFIIMYFSIYTPISNEYDSELDIYTCLKIYHRNKCAGGGAPNFSISYKKVTLQQALIYKGPSAKKLANKL